ncbi:hypothetical protein ACIHFE_17790 [Streptomyces sp. NPDC052396]|uniref:hypothetical protein n=1 Tax=Streptomyces sp. NPDC052396 TaxID=3365689 RepID=UPI0037D87048
MDAVAATRDGTPSSPRLVLDDSSFEVGANPGFAIEGMSGTWDEVEVTSAALVKTLRLHPERPGAARSDDPFLPDARVGIRSGIAPGSYPVTATLHGRTVATARLKVVPQGPAQVRRLDLEPRGKKAHAGEKVLVVLSDDHPAPDEQALTVESDAFGRPRRIREDSPDDPWCKCDDGATVYAGRIAVPKGTPSGTYNVVVISHHGRKKTIRTLAVDGDNNGFDAWTPWIFAGGAGTAVLGAGVWLAVWKRRRPPAVGAE